jgi:hypothetical protein
VPGIVLADEVLGGRLAAMEECPVEAIGNDGA